MKAIIFTLVFLLALQSCVESRNTKMQKAISVIERYKEEMRIKDSIENMFLFVDPDFTNRIVKINGVESIDDDYRRRYFKNKPAYDLLLNYDSILKVLPSTRSQVKIACDNIGDKRAADSLMINVRYVLSK